MNPNSTSPQERTVALSDLLAILLATGQRLKQATSPTPDIAKMLEHDRALHALHQFREFMKTLRDSKDGQGQDNPGGQNSGCEGCGNLGSDGSCMVDSPFPEEPVDLTKYQGMSPIEVILAVRNEERSMSADYEYVVFLKDVPVYRTCMPYAWVDGWCSAKGLDWTFDSYASDAEEHNTLPVLG